MIKDKARKLSLDSILILVITLLSVVVTAQNVQPGKGPLNEKRSGVVKDSRFKNPNGRRQKIPTHASETERNPYKYSTLNNFEGTAITNTTNTDQCGFKPIPKFGCEIGECINGVWKQNCSSPELECGFKPIPEVGCVVGKCINGTWEQVCKHRPKPECGFKPIPIDGCEVGACVNGQWETKCKGSPELECGFKPYPNDGCTTGKCVNGSWEQKCK